MLFGMWTPVGPRNHVLDWGPYPRAKRQFWRRKGSIETLCHELWLSKENFPVCHCLNATKTFNVGAIVVTPKRQFLVQKMSFRVWHIDHRDWSIVFGTADPLRNPQNPMLYNAFQSVRRPQNACSCGGSYAPSSAFQTASWSVQPFLRSSWQRVRIFFSVCVKMRLTLD